MPPKSDMLAALLGESEGEQLRLLSKVPPTLSLKDGVARLSFEAITMSSFEAGKKIPARHRWEGKELRFEATEASLSYVKRTWPNVIILKPAVQPAPLPEPPKHVEGELPWRPRMAPFPHQEEAFRLGAPKKAFAYLMDMGTGKSKAFIDDCAFHFARGDIDRVLVIAPNGVHEQWVDDALEEHWPLSLPIRAEAVLTGDTFQKGGKVHKRRPDFMANPAPSPGECLWLTVNIENIEVEEIRRGQSKEWRLTGLAEELVPFLEAGRAMIGIDESHKIKNHKAKRTIACWKLGKLAKFRRIMTGTPVAKGLEDYYAQFRFLDPGIIGVWSMSGFQQQFCTMGGFDNRVITGYRDTGEFHTRIAPYSYRVEKDDVLGLPPKLFSKRTCELTAQQRRIYAELRDELMTELSNGRIITTQQAMSKFLRLQQVTQGFLPLDPEATEFEVIPTNRVEPLMELVEQAPGNVVVWARFQEDITRLMALLGSEAVRYDGQNTGDREEVKERWLLGTARIFVGNPQAGGTGLDWINRSPRPPSTVIYYSNSYASLDRWQSEDRTHRMGTRGTVNYYDIICRGTTDAAILRNLKRKRDISDMSLQELKDMLEFG
jgi:hypothetical protein